MANVNFNELITFTRASGGGRFNAQGVYEWVPANEPRIDYDPVTGECRGLLIEESRTNLLLRSSEFDDAYWVKTNASVTANAAVAPDGTLTADKLVGNTTNGDYSLTRNIGVISPGAFSVSCYAKAGEDSRIVVYMDNSGSGLSVAYSFNLSTGAVVQTRVPHTSWTSVSATATPVGNGWYRCSISGTTTNTALGVRFFLDKGTTYNAFGAPTGYTGDGYSGIYIWGAQLEIGAFPTSYIPTTTAQVTRAADVASVNVLSPWYNPEQGTVIAKHSSFKTGNTNSYLWTLRASDDATMIRVSHGWGSPTAVNASVGSSGVVARGNNALPMRTALSWRNGEPALFSTNNGEPVSTTPGPASVPTNPSFAIGRYRSASLLNGHIESIRYFPRALSNAELQRITA